MEVRRVLNNNAVLVVDDERGEHIVLGKAIGYGKRPGDAVDARLVAQTFVPDGAHSIERLSAFLADIGLDVVRVAADIAEIAHAELGVRVSQALLLPIADHLAFAIARIADQVPIEYPLRWEVTQLYPKEVELGRRAVALVNQRLGVSLPPEESIPLALHLVNAQFATEGLMRTIQMTERISQVMQVIESGARITIDPDSMSAARFVTHLRYLFVRLDQHKQIVDSPHALMSAIVESHPEAYELAKRVAYLLEMDGTTRLTRDEVLYLTLHVARVTSDVR